jgi:hypothetical protein
MSSETNETPASSGRVANIDKEENIGILIFTVVSIVAAIIGILALSGAI